jgi:hypothetical protein
MTTTDPVAEVRMLFAILGPTIENAVITNTTVPRVLFDMLHLGDAGPEVRHWDLTVPDAVLLLTGVVDGANYVMQLQQLADERERNGLN